VGYLGLQWVFGVVIPYLAVLVFATGFVRKVMGWSRSVVPFAIPTTGGQAKSFPWIQHAKFDSPDSRFELLVRMALEILTFRSLFRNTRMKLSGGKLSYQLEIFLWVGALGVPLRVSHGDPPPHALLHRARALVRAAA